MHEITVGISRKFPISGERQIEWSFIRRGRIREFPRWDRVWPNGNCPASDWSGNKGNMVCGKRDANGKTKNVIRFRASLSRTDVDSISGIVYIAYMFLEKKKKKTCYRSVGIIFNLGSILEDLNLILRDKNAVIVLHLLLFTLLRDMNIFSFWGIVSCGGFWIFWSILKFDFTARW